MTNLRISLIQTDLVWEDAKANKQRFEQLFKQIDSTDLILLPEMFTTGFTMNSEAVAEKMVGESLAWMKAQAKAKNAVICGSLIIEEQGKYFNRLVWMQPDGEFETYDKRHLFRMADEDQHFSGGNQRLITDLKGWKICPLICYDLRFPVWARNRFETDRKIYAKAEYDLLLYIANWPQPRVEAWKKLLYARAIENQVYVAGLNRIGKDGKEVPYSGGSLVIDAKGEDLWAAQDHHEEIKTIELNKADLEAFRKKFPVGMDADEFELSY